MPYIMIYYTLEMFVNVCFWIGGIGAFSTHFLSFSWHSAWVYFGALIAFRLAAICAFFIFSSFFFCFLKHTMKDETIKSKRFMELNAKLWTHDINYTDVFSGKTITKILLTYSVIVVLVACRLGRRFLPYSSRKCPLYLSFLNFDMSGGFVRCGT